MLMASEFSRVMTYITEYLGIKNVWDFFRVLIDIGVVSFLFYKILYMLRDSRALQLIKGVVLILVLSLIADFLELSTVSYLIKLLLQILPVLIVVMFQPEIRRAIEGIGKNKLRDLFVPHNSSTDTNVMVEEVVKAVFAMSEEKVGALIVFERSTNLGEIIRTGTLVEANVSTQLLRMIFVPKTPLHDGAVIIRSNKIYAAACYLPLTDNPDLSKDLGTRHRAGIGITETADCITVIVSEETGTVSIARNGVLTRNMTPDILRKLLRDSLIQQEEKAARGWLFFRRENKTNKKDTKDE